MDFGQIQPTRPEGPSPTARKELSGSREGKKATSSESPDLNAPAPEGSLQDSIERSAESEKALALLREFDRLEQQESREKIEQLREEMRESRQRSHETLLRAAEGVLRGELIFP